MAIRKNILLGFVLALFFNQDVYSQQSVRLINNWQFLKQDIGGIWEAVRPVKQGNPESVPIWTNVTLPHCVNATDAVDPDVNYYQGPAWYRTQLTIENPYKNGRTLLHFEGAGQKSEVYVYTTKVGAHTGGYDEWAVDITEAVEAFKKTDAFKNQFKGKIPISIKTDNSRDLEMIPSNLSDFNLYGGIYRYLNLVYVPSLSIDKLFVHADVDNAGKVGKVSIKTRFYNPENAGDATVLVKIIDPSGKI
ncbi:MAG: sugar-binding domain-containing protein, partial [Ginsengibacter sp.]